MERRVYQEDDILELVELGPYGSFPLQGLNAIPGLNHSATARANANDFGLSLELVTGGIELIRKSA